MASIHYSVATPTADSYVSIDSANSYFEYKDGAEAWNNIDGSTNGTAADNKKAALLKAATREIDKNFRFYSGKWNTGAWGATDYQALEFPRACNSDTNGDEYIPPEVKYATYEQALWILERTGKRTAEDAATIEKQTIGMEAQQYLRPYITRVVLSVGAPPYRDENA